jgi:tetratricopeptide (TPR) repeat protein
MPRIPLAISRSVWSLSCTAFAGGAILMAAAALPASLGGTGDRDACAEASGSAAIAACTRAITLGNYERYALAKLHYNRAFEYSREGSLDSAIAGYTEAIRLDPSYALALYGRGNAWRSKGYNDRAIADYSYAIR